MKKILKILTVLGMVLLLFNGCSEKQEDPNKALAYIKQLDSYMCSGKLEVINDAQNKEYTLNQVYNRGSGNYLKIDDNRQIWFLNDKIIDNDIKRKKVMIQSRVYENIFEWTFLDKYIEKLYSDEKINTKYEDIEGKRCLLVELILCSNNRNLDKAVVYINTEDGNPDKIVIYDGDKNERIKITYDKFEGNAKIRDDFFDTKKLLNSD